MYNLYCLWFWFWFFYYTHEFATINNNEIHDCVTMKKVELSQLKKAYLTCSDYNEVIKDTLVLSWLLVAYIPPFSQCVISNHFPFIELLRN